ncbi:MAG: 16S rRNA (cytosine(1402)-N(4))-methyltransferase RsmH [Kineosporiaceae bacterium]
MAVDAGGQRHVPVLADEVESALAPALDRPGPRVLVDGTLGLGGHTLRLAAARPDVAVVGVDLDPRALAVAAQRLSAAGVAGRVRLVEAGFDDLPAIEAGADLPARVDAVLLDLGVSSLQLDSDDRGFAYSRDTALDMRMGRTGPTASDVLASYSAKALETVFREHGDERFARAIAAAVVRRRAERPLRTTAELVDLVYATVPAPARRTGGHPAKRVFQALRIEVNDEAGALRRALPEWADRLGRGGRLAVLTYHSGEDRPVKHRFGDLSRVDAPPRLPVEPPSAPFRVVGRPVVPGPVEIAANPRAASARLRVLERLAE